MVNMWQPINFGGGMGGGGVIGTPGSSGGGQIAPNAGMWEGINKIALALINAQQQNKSAQNIEEAMKAGQGSVIPGVTPSDTGPPEWGGRAPDSSDSLPPMQVGGGLQAIAKVLAQNNDPEMRKFALQMQMKQFEDKPGFSLPAGGARYDSSGKLVAERAAAPDKPPDIARRAVEAGLVPGTPEYQKFIRDATLKPQVAVNLGAPEPQSVEKMAELDAKRVAEITDQGHSAYRTLDEITRMETAMKSGKFRTGVFAEPRYFMSQLAEFVGVDAASIGLGLGDPATADSLDSASKKLAAEAAKSLGRITNMSLGFIKDSLPALSRTPEGNQILLDVMKRGSQRQIEIGQIADQYTSKYGTLRPKDEKSFYNAVRDLEEKQPVISPELRARIAEGSRTAPKSWSEVLGSKTPAATDAPTAVGPGGARIRYFDGAWRDDSGKEVSR